MKKFIVKTLSCMAALVMLTTMLSCLFGISASADETTYDSGNMPTWFFDANSWVEGHDYKYKYTVSGTVKERTARTANHAYELADGSIRFNNNSAHDFGSEYINSEMTFDFKGIGDWSIVLRADSAISEGYVFGCTSETLFIKKISCSDIGVCNTRTSDIYDPMKWSRMTFKFEDYDGYTVIKWLIDGLEVPFVSGLDQVKGTGSEANQNAAVVNGDVWDFAPIRGNGTYMAIQPRVYESGIISNPTNAVYFRSIDTDVSGLNDVFRIQFVGDSITNGSLASSWNATWSSQMNYRLNGNTNTTTGDITDAEENVYDCYNAGHSASTAMGLGTAQPYTYQYQYTFSKNFGADLTVIMQGTNDSTYIKYKYSTHPAASDDPADIRAAALQKFYEDYNKLAKTYIDQGAQVVLVTPPYATREGWTEEELLIIREKIIEIAGELDVPYFDMWTYTYGKIEMFPDQLHPNDEGYVYFADGFYAWLTEESGIDLNKKSNTVTLTTADNTDGIAAAEEVLTEYTGTFNNTNFRGTSTGTCNISSDNIFLQDGSVGGYSGAVSIPSYNLGSKWELSFTYKSPSSAWNDPKADGPDYTWEKYTCDNIKVGGLEFRIYKLKKSDNTYYYGYRLFMNNNELCDPAVYDYASWSNLTVSYKIEYSFGSIKIVRTNDEQVIFDLDSSAMLNLFGTQYRFNGVRIAVEVYMLNVTATKLSVAKIGVDEAEYDITNNENGHIEINGNTFVNGEAHFVGEKVTLTAVCDTYGYMFIKWVDANGNKLSTDPNYTLTFGYDKVTLRAVFGPYKAYSDINFLASAGGRITYNGGAFDYNAEYIVGDTAVLTAEADTGYEFSHWVNAEGEIVSTDISWTVILPKKEVYTAVFNKTDDATATVVFYRNGGKLVSTVNVAAGTVITLPELPFTYGYECLGWTVDGEIMPAGSEITVNGSMIVSAALKKSADKYTVSVSGGTVDGSDTASYVYNTKVTVVFDSSLLGENETFRGWHVGGTSNDASVISYDTSYTFFVGADVELIALTGTGTATPSAVIEVTDNSLVDGGERVSFLTERTLPEGYVLVKSGVIYTADSTKADSLDLGNIGGTVSAKKSTFTNKNGQFRITLSSRDGSAITVYLRAYLVYMDDVGVTHTIYSDVYSNTTVSQGATGDVIDEQEDIL